MLRHILVLAFTVFFALGGVSISAQAEQCRDAKGKFIKCPEKPAPTKCRDKTTKKFAKCAAPNSETVPAK